ncbi:DUF2787 family protein [Vibrio parahaemolyticus]
MSLSKVSSLAGADQYQMWEQNFLQYVEWECYDDIQISH